MILIRQTRAPWPVFHSFFTTDCLPTCLGVVRMRSSTVAAFIVMWLSRESPGQLTPRCAVQLPGRVTERAYQAPYRKAPSAVFQNLQRFSFSVGRFLFRTKKSSSVTAREAAPSRILTIPTASTDHERTRTTAFLERCVKS